MLDLADDLQELLAQLDCAAERLMLWPSDDVTALVGALIARERQKVVEPPPPVLKRLSVPSGDWFEVGVVGTTHRACLPGFARVAWLVLDGRPDEANAQRSSGFANQRLRLAKALDEVPNCRQLAAAVRAVSVSRTGVVGLARPVHVVTR